MTLISENASRFCNSDGEWSNLTDYSSCMELCIEVDHINQTTKYIDCGLESLQDADTEISVHVYFVGESVGCFIILTFDHINSASITFSSRYYAIFKYVIFLLYDKSKGSLK